MIFTEEQIKEILKEIEFQHLFFIAQNVSADILSDEDKSVLQEFGIDWQTLRQDYTPYEQAFYFGRLAAILGPLKSQQVDYNNLMKYLRRGQFIPLSAAEKQTLSYLEQKTYSYIKDLGYRVGAFVTETMMDEAFARRQYYEEVINNSIKRAVIERDTASSVAREIGTRTQDWTRDLGRIAETEMQNAFEWGKAETLLETTDPDAKVFYKQVYPGACRHCIRLYLTGGIGSEPRLFSYRELLDNGTNIGRRAENWLPVLGTVHPYCFDDQTMVLTDRGWRYFKDLDKTEKFLSVNLETGEGEWVKAVKWIAQEYNGKMILRENRSFSLCNTPNHYHVVKTNYEGAPYLLRKETELPKNFQFLRVMPEWKGTPRQFIEIGSKRYDTNLFCEFLGYYLSEGSLAKSGLNYRICISQQKESRQIMFNCCKKLFNNKCCMGKEDIEVYCSVKDLSLWEYLKQFGHSYQKYVPEEIKELPREQLEIFLQAYFLGDGTWFKGGTLDGYKCKDQRLISSSSIRMIDDLSEIIIKLGNRPSFYNFGKTTVFDKRQGKYYTSNYDQWEVRECTAKHSTSESLKSEEIDYKGFIYDVELERNHTLFVRRNNKVCLSGNCRCDLRMKRNKKDVWNEKKGIFEPKEKEATEGKIEITVGDKKFFV